MSVCFLNAPDHCYSTSNWDVIFWLLFRLWDDMGVFMGAPDYCPVTPGLSLGCHDGYIRIPIRDWDFMRVSPFLVISLVLGGSRSESGMP